MRLTVLNFTRKKLALWFIAHEFIIGHCPTMSSSRPRHMISVLRPCFLQLFRYVTLNANQRTKERGGARNEAKHLVALQHMCRGRVAKMIPGVGLLPVTARVPVLIATQISGVEAAKNTANT